ncbi:MAG: DUF6770 family protein [Bacteroidota bacterium]
MSKLKTLILIPVLLFATGILAQTTSISDIGNIRKVSSGYIIENEEIKGYYVFSRVDKVAKKTYAYRLQIYDANMNLAVTKSINKPKNAYLAESSFNGEAFMFLFVNLSKKTIELETYDKTGTKLGSKLYEKIKPNDIRLYAMLGMLSEESNNPTIFPVGKRGFLRIRMQMNGMSKYNYQLEYFSNDMSKSESWTVGTPKDSKMIEFPAIHSVSDKLATVIITRRKGAMSKNFLYAMQLLDMENGEVLFEEPMLDKEYNRSVLYGEYEPTIDEVIVAGNYYDVKDKTTNGKPLGLYFQCYDKSGKQVKKSYLSWDKDVSKFLDVNAKGRIKEGGFITLHKMVRTEDGKIYAIGERFRKAVSGAGVAMNVLAAAGGGTSGISNAKIVLEEMYVFEMDKDFKLLDVKIFDKRKSNVLLPAGAAYSSPTLLAYILKGYGWFDYSYTQKDKKRGIFYSTYLSTLKEKGEGIKPIFGVIAYDGEGGFTEDKINLKSKATEMWVQPAKPGYVSIWEYHRKEKNITVRLEPINY